MQLLFLNVFFVQRPLNLLLATLALCALQSCAQGVYTVKPLDAKIVSQQLSDKTPSDTAFEAFLLQNGVSAAELPLRSWTLSNLTLAAVYFNPKLTVAKAQLAVNLAAVESANQPLQASVDANIGRGNQGGGEPKPWSYGFNLNFPLETANKRALHTEQATYIAEASKIEIAQTAWQLRSQISQDLILLTESIQHAKYLEQALKYENEILAILDQRVKFGLQSNTELSLAKLAQLNALKLLNSERLKQTELLTILAADVGLTPEKFNLIPIAPVNVTALINQQKLVITQPNKVKSLQEQALFNRLDIRASLARYQAAESKIKLEIAKQTPDILLSPAFLFDFGNSIWSLGVANLFTFLNDNSTLAREAYALRDVEAAQFNVLQAKVIADISIAQASYIAAINETLTANALLAAETTQFKQLEQQFKAGSIDRLALTQGLLSSHFAAKTLQDAQFKSIRAALAVEDVMQRPIYDAPNLND